MKKEGFGSILISKDAKVNTVLFLSIVLIFLLTVFYTNAMSIKLLSPGNLTYNSSIGRNVNFTFNVTWDRAFENQSNCTLFINTTSTNGWAGVANRTNGTGIADTKDGIVNNSISGINYTFTTDANYTWNILCYNGTTNAASLTEFVNGSNLTFLLDSSAPQFNFTLPEQTQNSTLNTSSTDPIVIQFKVNDSAYGLNMSANNSINLSIFYGGARVVFFNYTNRSDETRLSCSAVSGPVSTAATTCNATYGSFTSNGTYRLNISAMDALGTYSTGIATLVTVDQITPYITNITACANASESGQCPKLGASEPSQVDVATGGAQGTRIFIRANVTDNLTKPFHADLQFFNTTSGSWQTVNSTTDSMSNISNFVAKSNSNGTSAVVNFSFMPPTGRNEFEGRNATFRILVNDTLGNRNTNASGSSGEAFNITVNINDTTRSAITINGTVSVNGSNLTVTVPLVSWSVIEASGMAEINVSVDGFLVGCNRFKRFTTEGASDGNADAFRNSSFNITNSAACTLGNGSHSILVKARDTYGNVEVVNHSFTVQSGGVPALTLVNLTGGGGLLSQSAVNNSNLTSSTARANVIGLGFSGLGVAASGVNVANLSYVSGCNSSSTVYFTNATIIYPFNESSCPTESANRSLVITATDTAGNSNSTTFTFLVDNVAPSMAVWSPTDGQYFANTNVSFNFSARDNDNSISFIGYYLDSSLTPIAFNTSTTGGTAGQGINNSDSRLLNFTPGTHTVKLTSNDSLGNVVNSSVFTFTITGPLNFSREYLNSSLLVINTNISFVNLTNSSGDTIASNNLAGSAMFNTRDDNWSMLMKLNHSASGNNLSIANVTIVFNASAANWDKNFSISINDSKLKNQINQNFSADLLEMVSFNGSIQEFLSNNNSYYGMINFKIVNATQYEIGGKFEVWYFPDLDDVSAESNLSECSSSFSPSFTLTACWNYTDNSSIRVYVPHFSGVGFVNNSGNPTVNVTTPTKNNSLSMFVPNITVSADAIGCMYSINSSLANKSMTLSSQLCIGSTERFINLETADADYNITFTVNDSEGNINTYLWTFNVSDGTAPNNGVVTSSGTTTGATITITGANESVNTTVNYGTTNTSLSSSETSGGTDFNVTQTVTISSLATVSTATTYHYNITVCDFNGNCKTNGTFTFTQSATAAAAAASASSSSGGGGGGAVSSVAASAGRQWDSIAAGSTATLTINNAQIAVTGVTINMANTVSNADITVESLNSNPYTDPASDKVYQYLNLKKGNIADSDASKITITFKVPKSWLTSNGVSEDDIVLYRYNDGQWNEIPTTKTGTDGDYVTYESTTPGFSVFAIGVKGGAAPAEAQPTPEPTPTTPEPTTTTPSAPSSAPTAPAMEEKGLGRAAIGWIVVLVIVAVAGIGYFMWQRRKEY